MNKDLCVSLGCDKNLVDSETMLGMLEEEGYSFTDDETLADAVVVNTCCFIQDAKQESIDMLLSMAELKKNGRLRALVAVGCLAQRYREEIQQEIPEVDVIVGTTAIDEITKAVEEALGDRASCTNHYNDLNRPPVSGRKQALTTGGHYAYLKIAEGCDKHCTYCIIPKVRGNYRSIPMETLLKEAEQLAEAGVRELILVAQETTLYGMDLYGKKTLPGLLAKLCQIPGIAWIRLLYCYPEEIEEDLIQVIKKEPKICHYLDLPIQHASDAVLKRMGLREEIPDICLRTTLITGFPGETQEDYEELYRFVNEMEFDRLGAFTYSPEEGTAAEKFPDQVEEETKLTWQEEVMELEQEIIFDQTKNRKGQIIEAFVEGKLPDENIYAARTYRDAPDIDGYVFLSGADTQLMTGDFVNARVTGSLDYDLTAEIIP